MLHTTRGRHADRTKNINGHNDKWEAAYKCFFYVKGEGCTCIVGFAANLAPKAAKTSLKLSLNKEACTTMCKDVWQPLVSVV